MKRFATLKGSSSNPRNSFIGEKVPIVDDDSTSVNTGAETNVDPILPLDPPNLKVQKLDYYYSRWTRSWKYKKMGSNAVAEVVKAPPRKGNTDDAWAQYCFVVVRTIRNDAEGNPIHSFKVTLKSEYLIRALKKVTDNVSTIPWNAEPLEIDPKSLLAFLPKIEEYHHVLSHQDKAASTLEDTYTLQTLTVILDYLKQDYRATISSFHKLVSHGEITTELLTLLFPPRTIVLSTCPITGEIQALKVTSVNELLLPVGPVLVVHCDYLDVVPRSNGGGEDFGLTSADRVILPFKGTKKIAALEVYPLSFHPDVAGVTERLITRGKKWAKLESQNSGMAHMSYRGEAAIKRDCKNIKYTINSRIMVDRANFKKFVPNYPFPVASMSVIPMTNMIHPPTVPPPQWDENGNPLVPPPMPWVPVDAVPAAMKELDEDELLLAPAVMYGFSLGDKMWLEFNVEKISPIQWNEEAFRSLVLPASRKVLLQSLVEAHHENLGFDDFVRGKGQGLVVNLFGPPGVGKTLSAEATSEHVKRPLYVIGAGDLGTNAGDLDLILTKTFELATAWKAIVLIDEADVFLEKRSMHDLDRNAMVAVFLRHLEYYRGILFLTTNRVQTFDDAFLSRIHIALRFYDLSVEAKIQVWRAFLSKLENGVPTVTDADLRVLAERKVNGREIKNAVRTANSLAHARGEKVAITHFQEVLDVMEEFAVEFKNGSNDE